MLTWSFPSGVTSHGSSTSFPGTAQTTRTGTATEKKECLSHPAAPKIGRYERRGRWTWHASGGDTVAGHYRSTVKGFQRQRRTVACHSGSSFHPLAISQHVQEEELGKQTAKSNRSRKFHWTNTLPCEWPAVLFAKGFFAKGPSVKKKKKQPTVQTPFTTDPSRS